MHLEHKESKAGIPSGKAGRLAAAHGIHLDTTFTGRIYFVLTFGALAGPGLK